MGLSLRDSGLGAHLCEVFSNPSVLINCVLWRYSTSINLNLSPDGFS